MSFIFKNAAEFKERAGLFVSLTGATNAGKSVSALRLGRGIAGPTGKLAVLDTEGGRTLHLKDQFQFDVNLMAPPFRPERFADAAKDAEDAGYACLVVDSFSMEWVGIGGVLDWQSSEMEDMVKRALARPNETRPEWQLREALKGGSWIKPKMAHKDMVYSLLQRRMPIIFAIRGEETFVPPNKKEFKSITNKMFPFEVTVSFRLAADRKGYIDLSDPKSYKMEGAHQAIFRDGDRISEEHGKALEEWARGATPARGAPMQVPDAVIVDGLRMEGESAIEQGLEAFRVFWNRLTREERDAVGGIEQRDKWLAAAKAADEKPTETAPADDHSDKPPLAQEGAMAAEMGTATLDAFWNRLNKGERKSIGGESQLNRWKEIAQNADRLAGVDRSDLLAGADA